MSYKPGDNVAWKFATSAAGGAGADADSLPTGTVVRNGVDDGTVTVTITHVATGNYKAAFTIPLAYAAGDEVILEISATIGGVTPPRKPVWGSGKLDSRRLADVNIDAGGNMALQAASIETVLRSINGYKNVYHVQTTGSDSNTGTAASPFLTVAHAASVAGAGDAIAVGAGTFTETSTVLLAAGVSLYGAGIGATYIQNATSGATVIGVSSKCVVRDLTVQATATPGASVFQYPIGDRSFDAIDVLILRVRCEGDTDNFYFTGVNSTVWIVKCQPNSNWDYLFLQNGATAWVIDSPGFTIAKNSAIPNSNSSVQVVGKSVAHFIRSPITNIAGNTNASRSTNEVYAKTDGTFQGKIYLHAGSDVYLSVDGTTQRNLSIDSGGVIVDFGVSYDPSKINGTGLLRQLIASDVRGWAGDQSGIGVDGNHLPKVDLVDWAGVVAGGMPNSGNVTLTPSEHTAIASDVQSGMTAQGATPSRMGYLDNINVGGPLASHADILAINQSASKHLLLTTVGQYEPGETYTIEMRTFSASDGSAVNADTTPTLTATGQVSGSLSANLSAATNPATGVYRWTYTPGATPTLEQIRFDGSAMISGNIFSLSCYSQTVDEATAVFTATNQAHLEAIYNKLPSGNLGDATAVNQTTIINQTNKIGTNAGDSPNEVTAQGTISTNLDAKVSTRSTYAGADTPGTTTLLSRIAQVFLFDAGGNVKSAPQTDSPGTTTLLARLGAWTGTGINTVLGALRAIANKAAALTPTDLSSGGTFDNTLDSLQAIRDRGDVAWLTGAGGAGGGGGGGTTYVYPLAATLTTANIATTSGGAVKSISIFQNTTATYTWRIIDSQGNPVDVSGHTLVFRIHPANSDTVTATASGADISLSQSDPVGHPGVYDTIAVTIQPAYVATAGQYEYKLRDTTSNQIYGSGPFVVKWAP